MNKEIDVSVRFLNLTKFQGLVLTKEIKASSSKKHSKLNQYVGYIPVVGDNMHEILNFMERQNIEKTDADIFISVASSQRSDIFEIPNLVNEMLQLCNFKLTFSFTCLLE